MAMTSSRFSSLDARHFRAVRFSQRIAGLCDELDWSRDLVQWQCLSATVIMTSIAYLLARGLDSLWALALIIPILAIGSASLQHALTLYRFYVQSYVMPVLCEALGRFRYTIGEAPDLCFNHFVVANLLPRHSQRSIDDVFFGEHRGHRLTLAMVNLWHGSDDLPQPDRSDHLYRAVVIAIRWPTQPTKLPADELTPMIEGRERFKLIWSEGYLMLAIPCRSSPFDLGGLFDSSEQFEQRLKDVAMIVQLPQILIDHLLENPSRHATGAHPDEVESEDVH